MTVTYNPSDPNYFVPSDLRAEMTRVFDLCHGCRLCLHLCPSFPTLFDAIDSHDGDVGRLTNAEADQVVDECYQCKLCYNKCPYVPPHEWELDFPRLMLRAKTVAKSTRREGVAQRLSDEVLGRTDLVGVASVTFSSLANRLLDTNSTVSRTAMEKTIGIASQRLLPPYAKMRFSTWFSRRGRPFVRNRQSAVAVFPTCFIEYMDPEIGKATVAVYEHNGVSCSVPTNAKCCGAPWLHGGDVEKFKKVAEKNVEVLAAEVGAGRSIVVAQPTCAYVIKKDYPLYLGTEQAAKVAEATFDTSEYLMKMYRQDKDSLARDFSGEIPENITYHAPCHLQAQNIGFKSRDLMKLTGAKISLVTKCSGIDGTWGYRAKNYQLAKRVAQNLAKAIDAAPRGELVGDCHLANYSITEETKRGVSHPMMVMARAYGLDINT